MDKLNLFYSEPNPDRWFKYDRYPRRVIRRVIRGKERPGGIQMFTLQLLQGLNAIQASYRFNDYRHAAKNPEELVCINGKPQVLFDRKWDNPVLFGPGVYSHPLECPDLFEKYPNVQKIILSCEWMKQMFVPYYGAENIIVWPVGIDTNKWNPALKKPVSATDFLIYDKVRWQYEHYRENLLLPIQKSLSARGFSHDYIRYGNYTHEILLAKLAKCKAVIFLCEHETQGLAYQQILATGTPILAWDRGGYWRDPQYYPERVQFGPVSSVPYWDNRCGLKFKDSATFEQQLPDFMALLERNILAPRNYILENLTLEKSAEKFVQIVGSVNTAIHG
jgi:glycosyltransferase involved in cell wall biosynthesis